VRAHASAACVGRRAAPSRAASPLGRPCAARPLFAAPHNVRISGAAPASITSRSSSGGRPRSPRWPPPGLSQELAGLRV
jgi:hypothetical protein